MQRSAVANKLFLGALVSLFGLLWMPQVAHAAAVQGQNDVGAIVCTADGASLSITSPVSDSVVGNSVIPVSGDVQHVSQLEVYVDGSYNGTVALARNQTSFTTQVTVSQGTHTIRIEGTSICAGGDPTDEIVITVNPGVPPSEGPDTPTTVDSGTPTTNPPGSGIVVTNPPAGGDAIDGGDGVSLSPIINFVPRLIEKGFAITDIEALTKDNPTQGVLRMIIVIFGILFFSFGSVLLVMVMHALGFHKKVRVPIRTDIAVRGAGLVLFFIGISI